MHATATVSFGATELQLRVWSTAEEGKFPASNGAPRLIGPLNGGGSEGAAVTYLLRRFVRYSFKPTRFHSMSVSTASLLASLLASSKARVQDRTKLSLQVAANSCSLPPTRSLSDRPRELVSSRPFPVPSHVHARAHVAMHVRVITRRTPTSSSGCTRTRHPSCAWRPGRARDSWGCPLA